VTPEQESELLDLLPRLRELVSGSDSTLHYHSLDRSGTIASLTDITNHHHSLLSSILGAGSYHLSSGAATAAETLAYGTYTPTSSANTNVAASTFYSWGYVRLGPVVIMGGHCDIDPTAAGFTSIDISIPISSAFTDSSQAAIVGGSYISAGTSIGELIIGAAPAANTVRLNFTAVSTASNRRYVLVLYQVI